MITIVHGIHEENKTIATTLKSTAHKKPYNWHLSVPKPLTTLVKTDTQIITHPNRANSNAADKFTSILLDEIGCTLDSFASVGSVVPYYETHKKIYSSLLQNQRTEIREWAQRQINACNYYIQHAQINEEEKL